MMLRKRLEELEACLLFCVILNLFQDPGDGEPLEVLKQVQDDEAKPLQLLLRTNCKDSR